MYSFVEKKNTEVKRNSMRAKLLHNILKKVSIPNIVTSFHLNNVSDRKIGKEEQDNFSPKVSLPFKFHAVADVAFGEQNVLSIMMNAPGTITGKYYLRSDLYFFTILLRSMSNLFLNSF